MKKLACLVLVIASFLETSGQWNYDSVTISRFLISDQLLGKNWRDTLNSGRYPSYLSGETTTWRKQILPQPRTTGVMAPVQSLTQRIKANGTEDVAKCFIPRHSINYYKGGKIVRFLQVCFECDGLRFSDDPSKTFVKSVPVREKQMAELKELFKGIEQAPAKAKAVLYDSITISRIKGGWNMLEPDKNELVGERSIWTPSKGNGEDPRDIMTLTDSIKSNGTGPIGRCFFPRHRVNYYKDGKLALYLLVCFECNELQFSDDNFPEMFVKDKPKRMQQMDGLRVIFKDLLSEKN